MTVPANQNQSTRGTPRRRRPDARITCEIFPVPFGRPLIPNVRALKRATSWKRPTPTTNQAARVATLLAEPTLIKSPLAGDLMRTASPEAASKVVKTLLSGAVALENLFPHAIDYADMTGRLLNDLGPGFLTYLDKPDLAYLVEFSLNQRIATSIRAQSVWAKTTRLACDTALPERRAIEEGPEAMRAFVAAGGCFTAEQDGYGLTDAHVAAFWSTWQPHALATFLDLGGPFHSLRNRYGSTPSNLLFTTGNPTAVYAFLDAGGIADDIPNAYGCNAAYYVALHSNEDFRHAVSKALGWEAPP